jgi:hypothetical protein
MEVKCLCLGASIKLGSEACRQVPSRNTFLLPMDDNSRFKWRRISADALRAKAL